MRYYLWIDGKQDGPFEPTKIRALIDSSRITDTTLAHPEGDIGEWSPIRSYTQIFELPKPPEAVLPAPHTPAAAPKYELPRVEGSAVADALTFFAVLEFIGGIIGGFIVGGGYDGKPGLGFMVFAGGVLSGLILLGFAQVIQHTKESSQRLLRIEMIIQKAYDDKDAA